MSKRQDKRRTIKNHLPITSRMFSFSDSRMPPGCFPFAALFGILIFIGGVVWLGHSLFLVTHGTSTKGTVSNLWTSRTDDNFDVTFQISQGQHITVSTSKSIGFEPYQDGSIVPILYNPTDPHEAAVNTFSALWFRQGALVLFGALIAIFYIMATYALVQRILQQRKNSRQELIHQESAKPEVQLNVRKRKVRRVNRSKLNRTKSLAKHIEESKSMYEAQQKKVPEHS